jgi:hypothetical protein
MSNGGASMKITLVLDVTPRIAIGHRRVTTPEEVVEALRGEIHEMDYEDAPVSFVAKVAGVSVSAV